MDSFYTTILTAGVIVAILHVLSLLNMVVCYRKHMLRFYKGDKEFLAKFVPGKANICTPVQPA